MSEEKIRLTHPQRRIWYAEKLHPGTGMFNNAGTLKLTGKIDFDLLERCILAFVRQNQSVRIRIGEDGEGPYQYVAPYEPFAIQRLDFSGRGDQALFEWDDIQNAAPMSMTGGPLYFFALIRMAEDRGCIYAKFHHIISDAVSMVSFAGEVLDSYDRLLKGERLPERQYRCYLDYAAEERDYLASRRFAYDQKYWLSRFADVEGPTHIKDPAQGYSGTRARRKARPLSARLSARMREFCRKREYSVFSLFLTALCVYLYRVTGRKDLVLSAPVSNRTRQGGQADFGMYISTVPLRLKVDEQMSFEDFSEAVSEEWFAVLKHQKYPYDLLMRDLRARRGKLESLFDITLSYQIGSFQRDHEQFTCEGRWHFPGYQANSLSIHLNDREDSGKFILDIDYWSPYYQAREIDYLAEHLLRLIESAMARPQAKIFELPMMPAEERERVVEQFSHSETSLSGGTLCDLWNERVLMSQEGEAAFCFEGQDVSVRELNARSAALASLLREKGVGRGVVCGLMLPRGRDYIEWMLAVARAGGCFMPLDPSLPETRLVYMMKNSGAKVLVCRGGRSLPGAQVVIDAGVQPEAACPPRLEPKEDDSAYIIYTSGSTGTPKGVVISAGSAAHFVRSMRQLWEIGPGSRMVASGPVCFDISLMEMLPYLLTPGAGLAVASEKEAGVPSLLAALILESGANHMMFTPARMELLLSDQRGAEAVGRMSRIGMGGDVLPRSLLARVQKAATGRIYNFYGPTEITISATVCEVTSAGEANIGRPMADVTAYILDEHRSPVPIGVPGELYIGGAGLAKGYVGREDLTAERFIPSPFAPGRLLYRTGDLCRWYPRGEIKFLGRIDQQVKLRGYRIELGEVEAALAAVPGVEACAAAVRQEEGRKTLTAFLVGKIPSKEDIYSQLADRLPPYMIPSQFVAVESIPLSPSGKIDRRALERMEIRGAVLAEAEGTPPATQTEKRLAEIWKKLLEIDHVSREDNFFEIGGDSLLAVSMVAAVRSELSAELPMEEIYEGATLKRCAAAIDAAEKRFYKPIAHAARRGKQPASPAELRMWLVEQTAPCPAYHVPMLFEVGEVEPARLARALTKLAKRHPILRTGYRYEAAGLFSRVEREVELPLLGPVHCDEGELRQVAINLMPPFDLSRPPLLRAALLEECGKNYLLLDAHHIICDQATALIWVRDLTALYDGRALPAPLLTYADYAAWLPGYLESEAVGQQREYWKKELTALPPLELPAGRRRPRKRTYRGATEYFRLPVRDAQALKSFAAGRGAGLFSALLAVFSVFLNCYTGQEDFAVGVPYSGRGRAETQGIAGNFLNMLPIRVKLDKKMGFGRLVDQAQRSLTGALGAADYPYERMAKDQNAGSDPARNALFDVMLVLGRRDEAPVLGGPGRALPLATGTSKLDLTLYAYEDAGELSLALEYSTDLFSRAMTRRMCGHIARLAARLPRSADTPLAQADMLSVAERKKLTEGFAGPKLCLPGGYPMAEELERLAQERPKAEAVCGVDGVFSYEQLNRRANQIACGLNRMGLGEGDLVAVMVRRSAEMVAALFGVMKSGAAYLPIDADYPSARIAYMLRDSGAKALLTDCPERAEFSGAVLSVRQFGRELAGDNPKVSHAGQAAAYVIYTSGSTGQPKGSEISKGSLENLYQAMRPIIAREGMRAVSVTTVCFDIFVTDGLLPILYGMPVAVADEEEQRQAHLLAALIEKWRAGYLQTTPSRMNLLMEDEAFLRAGAEHLKTIVVAGEKPSMALVCGMQKAFPAARLLNGYGPTEATVYSSFQDLTHAREVSIGRPIGGMRFYLMDDCGRLTPPGVPGTAYIAGAGVCNGYVGRRQLNREKFLPDPFVPGERMYDSGDVCVWKADGELLIQGRRDGQVKLHGLRIELGEIETLMRRVPGVTEAAVVPRGEGENMWLCAYLVGSAQEEALRAALARELPGYMVPSRFVYLEEMPYTGSGKIDRNSLPKPEKAPRRRAASLSAEEKKMERIWRRVLGVDGPIQPEDSFFALGGDSIGVIRVQAAAHKLGWELSTRRFYETPTLSGVTRLAVEADSPAAPGRRIKLPERARKGGCELKRVLLTGAAGYLGCHLAHELAAEGAQVYCLVRGDARARMQQAYRFYFDSPLPNCLIPVEGDIARENLGLDEQVAREIASGALAVLHCAAKADHVGAWEDFEAANVVGTRHAAEFAERAGAELLHISTLSVSGGRAGFLEEDYDAGQGAGDNAYRRSKFLAEGEVASAMRRGLPAQIFRIGNLTARLDGTFQMRPERNAFYLRICVALAAGCVPQSLAGAKVDLTPVEECARAILLLAASGRQSCYHVVNPDRRTVAELAGLLGLPVRPDEEFHSALARAGKEIFLPEGGQGAPEDSARTQKLLSALGFAWPAITPEYLKGWFKGGEK